MERRGGSLAIIRALSVSAAWLVIGSRLAAGADPVPRTPAATVRTEIARGAATIGVIVAKKYPYATIRRLIRESLEKNVQAHRDSDGFLVGAHLAALAWIERLASDLSWRERARAHHRDIVEWLRPRIGLPDEEIARIVSDAAGFTPAIRQRLLQFLGEIRRPTHGSV